MKNRNFCPVCNTQYQIQCRCLRAERICENGHTWHICVVHDRIVLGEVDHKIASNVCTCMQEE